ncbi:FYVE, RhoGEF and PH domain-containing protein 6 [Trichonephila inaurata madagascariensis]|uniref:FYVE, RhoGEF and PH domain-containing protein 6 n=1 Tax=Trichonephila inaurata madagascariensis TaxID=2747483 RepID=A0A8X6XUW3_9ARAC|nr:FYVE, RhoGEF and PH domain-containing protein 6 [Trichonephila inaurata madagascariensis]
MDAANAETSTNKPPLLPKPCLNVASNEPVEHVIPQMVITSADDEAEQVQDTPESLPELGVSTFETSATSFETKELKDFNVPEETIQEQQLQNGNQAVEGTFDVAHSKSIPQDQTEFKHEDSVPHSVIQRPLIIESEKCVPQSNITEINVQTSESPSPTPSLPPTTMQRPLVFDASSQQTDIFVLASEGTLDQCSPEISSTERKELEEEALAENEQIIDGDAKTSAVTKPKSSSFSWMPSFSKSHSSEKDEKPSDALSSKKDLNLKETQKLQDTEHSSKKDNLQNMKKFFDNLLHDTSADTKDKPITQDDHHESIDTSAKKVQKDSKHGVMKLFGPSKHEPESKGKVSPTPVDSKETENTAKEVPKESKFNVKKMLDSFIHDTKDTGHDSFQTEISKGKTGIASNDPVKEPEVVSKETTKDSKFNMKKMFDTFKHDTTEKKDVHDSSQIEAKSKKKVISTPNEPSKEPDAKMKDATKDSKFNVKKMFDSFKHDTSEKKDIVPDSCQIEERSTGKISPPPNEFQKDAEISPKDTSKDSKFNMKKMFDSFKHDAIEKKDTVSDSSLTEKKSKEKVNLNVNELPETTQKETSKDSKFNMKKMFDSFKHESVEKKDAMSDSVSGTKAMEASSSPIESDNKSKEASKDSKFNMKKMFDSFKHDSSEKKDVSELPVDTKTKEMNVSPPSTSHKETDSSSKDYKYVTKMLDSFKHDSPVKKDVISEMSKSDGNLVTSKSHKDSKSGFKKFFDSFKHDEITAAESSSAKLPEIRIGSSESCIEISSKPALSESEHSKQSPNKETITGVTSTTAGKPAIQSKVPDVASEVPKIKPKDGSVRKFLHSFKLDGSNAPKEKHHVTFLERDSLKRSHSFRDSILLKDEHSEKISKDSSHGFKKYFMSPKSADTQDSEKTPGKRKAKIKRSESCKETSAEKEGFHGIKSFFDSFTHKKSSQISTSPEEHIYDTVGKPEQSTSGLTHSRDITKQVTTKTVDSKQKEDPSSMKKLFDSFRHKDTPSKPKVAKETEKDGKDYEKVDISSNVPKVSESSKIMKDKKVEPVSKDIKKESQIGQNVEAQTQKNVPKIVLNLSPKIDKQKKSEPITVPSVQVNGPSSSTDSKSSMFTAISDNFTAIKDKMMHSKESKRKEIESPEKESEEYDLQNAAFKNQLPDSSSGSYRPINDDAFVNIDLKQGTETEKSKVDNVAVTHKKVTTSTKLEESSQKPVISEPLTKPNSKTNRRIEPGTPETLYDTCCMRLATLLGKKALEIVSEKTKTPPKKPPKPSAEAIAKARAAVVSQRLRDLQNKSQSIGESIPVGYDGIRFADEETESSCDYKDVENLDYIIDYELVNRYKCDSKLDTFSDPSTCSGISSYYTADTVTLKDETFSDAPLETISLGNDSYLFQHLSSTQNETDFHSLPSKVKSKDEREKLKSLVKSGQTVSSSTLVPTKKVPPPLPPKPAILQKQKDSQNKSDVSQCINGLSLSPRLQAKFSKDSAATQKRPLLVAGLKGTEFTSLQTKSKDHQSKERTFNTILKNESLKNISTIAPLHKPLQGTKSSPNLPQSYISAESSTSKKQSPQRPPPPISSLHTTEKKSKTSAIPPPVPEKPKRESRTASTSAVAEKRTVSPPRPPPPVFTKVNVPPPRPPPPSLNIKSVDETAKQVVENLPEINTLPLLDEQAVSQKALSDETSTPELDSKRHEKLLSDDLVIGAQKEIVLEDNQIQKELKDESSFEKGDLPESNTEKSLNKMADDTMNKTTIETTEMAPKPPPRGRRIRSRTVEIPPKQKTPESTLRRSQSLSDADIEKRTSPLLDTPSIKTDLKHLYTSVNKDGKKAILDGSQSPNASRPLPAPPPPPRKFRSLDRKPKEKQKKEIKADAKEIEIESVSPCSSPVDLVVKPPERKRKSDKQRFLSLSPQRKKKTSSEFETTSLRMPRSYSAPLNPDNIPLKPDRKLRHTHPEYDENANFAFPTVAEVHHSAVLLDECGNEIVEASSSTNIPSGDTVDSVLDNSQKINPHPRRKKEKNPKKSCSSWYDKATPSEEWEIVDWDNIAASEKEYKNIAVKPKMRRRSDPVVGRKIRQTSKFYVNVEVGNEGLPLVDKETSPLHLDCSEKSVQTSLETLSVGIMSRDEQSDNPESSDNTDKLLNIVKTLQTELKTTLNRHKSLDDEDNDTSNAATDSERTDDGEKKFLQTPSIQSSTSEIWPVSSSEESDAGISNEGATNLSEIALKRKKNKIFYIAREILTSEEVFVDTLKLLNVDFKAAIEAANKQRNSLVVPDEVLSQILNHLPQLQQLNENLMMELKDRIDNWDKTGKIADVIVKIGPFLKLYSWYIHDFESNISLLEESKKKYPAFAQVVKEFEASSRCKRLALNHFMLKPIQRIPQYRLLLQEYLHHLSEDSPDYPDTVTALQIVSEVAGHANDSMKQGDNAQKMISIQNSIMGHKEIIKPGRLFVKEGELMKLSRKGMQPRWFVLFNDLLLYLTPVQHGLYRINHELPLAGMKVAIPIQQDYQNEFSIISVTRSFTLAARSQEERQEWIVALTKAIQENFSKRSTFMNQRLQRERQDRNSEDDDGEFVLGKKAPVWIPDARVTMCQLCTSEFTVTFRRHHCRACGKVICSICSSNRIPLAYLGTSKVNRVCDECYSKLGPDTTSTPENAETDSDNQQIAVKPHLRTEHRHVKKGKRNLPSVLKEVCANDQGSTISGYLQKRVGKSWKKEWFVVKDKVLYEYKASEDVAALSSTPLLGYQIESFSEAYENVDMSLLFQLTHPGQAPIVFHTDSIGSTERWIAALKEASVLE